MNFFIGSCVEGKEVGYEGWGVLGRSSVYFYGLIGWRLLEKFIDTHCCAPDA
jgi:hypothetical protein